MTRSVRWMVAAAVVGVVAAGCVLRPQYRDLLEQSGESEGPVQVVFTEASTGTPLAGVNVSWGEGRERVVLTTDENGAVILPRDKRLAQQNPIIVVDRPAGVGEIRYEVTPAEASMGSDVPPTPSEPPIHIPPGGVGPGQPPQRDRQEPPMTGTGTGSGRDTLAPADGGTTAQ